MCGHAALGWWQVCPCILLWIMVFPTSGPAMLCAQDDFGNLFSEGHLPRQPELGDFELGLVPLVPAWGHWGGGPWAWGHFWDHPGHTGHTAPRAWQRSSQWSALGRCGPGRARGGGRALLSPRATAGRGTGVLGGLADPVGGGSPGWGSDTEGTEEEEEEGEGQGRKGWECPHCASLDCCMQDQGYLCCRRAWGRGRAAGAGPWGSSGCPSRATELTGPWSLRLNGCSALWSGHRSGMLLLEHLQGWNVGAPIVLSHSQECWGSPCPAPPHTPPKQLCQLLVGRERMNHRVGITENPEI